MDKPKYPDISVPLAGEDQNAFAILGRAGEAMNRGGILLEEIETFKREALSGNYDHLLKTLKRWVDTSEANPNKEPAPAAGPEISP